jgi:hypothetical protein
MRNTESGVGRNIEELRDRKQAMAHWRHLLAMLGQRLTHSGSQGEKIAKAKLLSQPLPSLLVGMQQRRL